MKPGLLLTILAALSLATGAQAQSRPLPPLIIDSHTHYRATDEWEKSFVAVYGKHHAMACLLIGMKDLDRGIAFAKSHPDMVIPYAAIDIDSPTVLDDIRRVKRMGFKGLGELFAVHQWNYDDPKYEPMWALADSLKMPVAPHTGILANGMLAHMPPDAVPAFRKIMFATDESPEAFEENIRRFEKMLDACRVDDATRAMCYGLTIARIHGIKTPPATAK